MFSSIGAIVIGIPVASVVTALRRRTVQLGGNRATVIVGLNAATGRHGRTPLILIVAFRSRESSGKSSTAPSPCPARKRCTPTAPRWYPGFSRKPKPPPAQKVGGTYCPWHLLSASSPFAPAKVSPHRPHAWRVNAVHQRHLAGAQASAAKQKPTSHAKGGWHLLPQSRLSLPRK